MLFVLLVTVSTLATAALLPSAPRSAFSDASLLNDRCTFILWHHQQSSLDYIQLNTIVDHANSMTIDVASHRPATAFNSYTRLDQKRIFAVAGLLDDKRLTIASGEGDVLKFEVGEVKWNTEGMHGRHGENGKRAEAWCDAGKWEGSSDRRKRILSCAFPCERIAVADLGSEKYGQARKEGSQARIGLV
ncbi:hypothetical protein C7974DRAFT_96269 [Boeremia exigua]|uniref:uncharacterized protein n=1 Tax=Boeremia exigua TaxID=749465 RepID=UPI001E8D3A53|nr:uncharacterized protein C7974DRAFT_96269 [Boeremia exigua]KAH6642156.1 hypothetical protein C7974DRAFT_96269 [Boeremia exigua]